MFELNLKVQVKTPLRDQKREFVHQNLICFFLQIQNDFDRKHFRSKFTFAFAAMVCFTAAD